MAESASPHHDLRLNVLLKEFTRPSSRPGRRASSSPTSTGWTRSCPRRRRSATSRSWTSWPGCTRVPAPGCFELRLRCRLPGGSRLPGLSGGRHDDELGLWWVGLPCVVAQLDKVVPGDADGRTGAHGRIPQALTSSRWRATTEPVKTISTQYTPGLGNARPSGTPIAGGGRRRVKWRGGQPSPAVRGAPRWTAPLVCPRWLGWPESFSRPRRCRLCPRPGELTSNQPKE
jgi:hypothetical protein